MSSSLSNDTYQSSLAVVLVIDLNSDLVLNLETIDYFCEHQEIMVSPRMIMKLL